MFLLYKAAEKLSPQESWIPFTPGELYLVYILATLSEVYGLAGPTNPAAP